MTPDALAESLARLGLAPDEAIALAISGGPDSLALLLIAAGSRPLHALTVDHALRPESAAEAEHVAAVSAALHVPHTILRWDNPARANLQAAARGARYGLMAGWCAEHGVRWLATAHHADDQAETLLLRLARGSGLSGLAGIRASRPLGRGVTLIRPLLSAHKADLVAVWTRAGIAAVDDPSNRSPAYDRTRARALLLGARWLDPARVGASAALLAEAEAALVWAAERAWEGRAVHQSDDLALDVADLPRELRFRLTLRALGEVGGCSPPGPEVSGLLDRLDAGGGGTLGGVRAHGGDRWRFRFERLRS